MTRLNPLLLWLIACVALIMRLYGHRHGLGFHPDERHIIMVVSDMRWNQLNPHSFAYGSLPFYLLWAAGQLMSLIDPHWASYDGYFLLGRKLAALIGTATVLATFGLAKGILKSSALALIAALVLAANPFHIQNSHFYTVDGLLTLLCTLCLLSLQRWWLEPSSRRLLRVAILLGLAFSTKIAAATLLLPVLLAIFDRSVDYKAGTKALWSPFTSKPFYLRLVGVLAVAALVNFLTMPYAVLDFAKFKHDILEQNSMVWGIWVPPYTIQYQGTSPYFYHLEQMARFTVGWPLFFLSLFGAARLVKAAWRNSDRPALFGLIWSAALFLSFASLQVKFLRYLLPIYPMIAVAVAAVLLPPESILQLQRQRLQRFGIVLLPVLALFAGLRALTIYDHEHTWFTASRWIYKNIPAGSVLIGEHWDDKIPLGLPGFDAGIYKSATPYGELPVYEDDTPKKSNEWCTTLSRTDVIALPTARGYAAIPRQPHRFPWTIGFFKTLFNGQLGFELAASFKVRPTLLGIELRDDLGDESLTVYDHPKALVFRNTQHKSADELCKIIDAQRGPISWQEWENWMVAEGREAL